jgi:hypothetical protein
LKITWIAIFLIGVSANLLRAWPRLGSAANIVTQNAGDKAKGISVTISTNSATLVYTGVNYYREVLLQNTSDDYYIHCGTFSAVTATAGSPRWLLPPRPTGFTTNGTYSIYCIVDPAAGSTTIEINGSIEFDDKDRIQ